MFKKINRLFACLLCVLASSCFESRSENADLVAYTQEIHGLYLEWLSKPEVMSMVNLHSAKEETWIELSLWKDFIESCKYLRTCDANNFDLTYSFSSKKDHSGKELVLLNNLLLVGTEKEKGLDRKSRIIVQERGQVREGSGQRGVSNCLSGKRSSE